VNNFDSNSTMKNNNTNINDNLYKKYKINEITYTIILDGDYSDGKYSIIEVSFPAEKEKEIPLHKHAFEDVLMCVLEGSFLIQYKNEMINGYAGMVLKLENGVGHSYKKVGHEIGKLLMTYTPAGVENYFRDLDSLSKNSSSSSSIADDLQILNKDDDRIRLHLLEKNYGWTFIK
jgi:quercetin dioxygenase-like cupin family protein